MEYTAIHGFYWMIGEIITGFVSVYLFDMDQANLEIEILNYS